MSTTLKTANILNIDETRLSIVYVPPKILESTGVQKVGSLTSSERRNTVTIIAACNACGSFVPPMFMFRRGNFRDFMIYGNSLGWSNETAFVIHESFYKIYINIEN